MSAGAELRAAVARLRNEGGDANFSAVLACLRGAQVWIPCRVTVGADIVLSPDTVSSGGERYLPVFSDRDQIVPNYGDGMNVVLRDFADAMTVARARGDHAGIVVDPFTRPFVATPDLFDYLTAEG